LSQHRRRLAGKKRRNRRSVRAFLLTTVIAASLVAFGARYMIGQFAVQADPLANAVGGIPTSHPAAELEQQRQHIILMAVATKSLKVVGSPTVAKLPAPVAPPAGGAPIVYAAPPNAGTAEAIAYNMLPSFGFSHSEFGCLNNIWSRESGWRWNAANASGAYGIPQALPGSKMASAGADWLTNPATQIKWGLGYIKSIYGTPCNAWVFWQAHSWY